MNEKSPFEGRAPLWEKVRGRTYLTKEGVSHWMAGYSALQCRHGFQPAIYFPEESKTMLDLSVRLRQKDWVTSDSWNSLSEQTGVAGDLALYFWWGFSAEEALNDFLASLQGDKGADLVLPDGRLLDLKSTRGTALKFKFSKSNRFRQVAHVIGFAQVIDSNDQIACRLLGWAWRYEIKPYQRDDGRCLAVRFDSLNRDELIHPMELLKEFTSEEEEI